MNTRQIKRDIRRHANDMLSPALELERLLNELRDGGHDSVPDWIELRLRSCIEEVKTARHAGVRWWKDA